MKSTHKRIGIITGAVLGVTLIVGCSGAGTKSNTSSGTPAGTSTSTAAAKPKAKPKTLMSFTGNGDKNSPKFTTGSDWTIHYSYDCSKFGFDGNFIVNISDDIGDDVNATGKKGADTQPIYDQSGTHHLEVVSECKWKVSVIG